MADVRTADLIRRLSEHGWEVGHRDRDVAWWADEIWTVESVWAPKGFTVFLAWLIDPMDSSAVWGVGVSLHRPTGRREAERAFVAALKHWPRDVPGLLETLGALRVAAAQLDRAPRLP
jgi:hypothetical protein